MPPSRFSAKCPPPRCYRGILTKKNLIRSRYCRRDSKKLFFFKLCQKYRPCFYLFLVNNISVFLTKFSFFGFLAPKNKRYLKEHKIKNQASIIVVKKNIFLGSLSTFSKGSKVQKFGGGRFLPNFYDLFLKNTIYYQQKIQKISKPQQIIRQKNKTKKVKKRAGIIGTI